MSNDNESAALRVEYVSIDKLKRWERNPKEHDLPGIRASFERFGYVYPILIDERSGRIAAGHGRIDALAELRDSKKPVPERIVVSDTGEWLVPVIRGVSFSDDGEMEAYGIADNRLTEVGGWSDEALAAVLLSVQDDTELGLDGIGFDESDLDDILSALDDEVDLSEFDSTGEKAILYRVIVDNLSLESANVLSEQVAGSRVEQYRKKVKDD